jgi:cytoskeletal protein CcmA (bactofilin family)
MAFFKRGQKSRKSGKDSSGGRSPVRNVESRAATDSSPQRVGVVSTVLSSPADADGETPHGDVIARRFGPPTAEDKPAESIPGQIADEVSAIGSTTGEAEISESALPPRYAATNAQIDARKDEGLADSETEARADLSGTDHLHAVEPLFSDLPASTAPEVDSMPHIGRSTIITGNIVAEEDLEILGTIEGSVRLGNHQLTIGKEGEVNASVDAHTVHVRGKINGDVTASELVEVEAGGIIVGDVQAPRIIMHDGAIVVGGLDMSAALSSDSLVSGAPFGRDESPDRPKLKKVVPQDDIESLNEISDDEVLLPTEIAMEDGSF